MSLDVLEYLDYRDFLRDWFVESKKQNRVTSYRYLGQKTGLDPAWLVRVFQKEGHLNEESIPTFQKLFAFDERRSEYFRILHRFCKSKSPDDQREHFQRLMELREMEARKLDSPELTYFGSWSTAALRALIGITQNTSDIQLVASRLSPSISASEAADALELLRKLNLVEPDGHGGWNITDRIVTTGNEVQSHAVRHYHRNILALAEQSLERHPPESRDISSVTLTIDEEDIPEIKERVAEFRRGLLQFARASENANRVYNLSISLFPLSASHEESSK